MKIGDKLNGRITGIQPYGAFVELETIFQRFGQDLSKISMKF